jgi:hypothetical protein
MSPELMKWRNDGSRVGGFGGWEYSGRCGTIPDSGETRGGRESPELAICGGGYGFIFSRNDYCILFNICQLKSMDL